MRRSNKVGSSNYPQRKKKRNVKRSKNKMSKRRKRPNKTTKKNL